MVDEKISELVKANINHNGYLVLDKELTKILVQWLDHAEEYVQKTDKLYSNLKNLLEDTQ